MKKKCPKCGEDNPPEAVMCWACYTPLNGQAAASSSRQPLAAATAGDEEKKKIAPWQIAVLGVVLLGGVFVGVRAMVPSSPDDEAEETAAEQTDSGTTPAKGTTSASAPPPPAPPSPSVASAPPVVPPRAPPAGAPAPPPQKLPYTIMVPPHPRLRTATMAIVPTNATATGPQAAALAAYTRRQYKSRITKRWRTLYIYVFADKESARYFAKYMRRKKGRPLTEADYTYLYSLWNSVLARYTFTTYKGKRVERILYPSKSPGNWWIE